jgi:hypothetical protein
MAVSDSNRFFVKLIEPPGENRGPIEFYRWHLKDAQNAADKLVQAYYPHECSDQGCGYWRRVDE